MAVTAVKAPRALGADGRRLWRQIASQLAEDGLVPDKRELELLRSAAFEADMLAKIEDALRNAPMTVVGAQGQLVAHPLIGEARRSRTSIAALLKQIGLQDPMLNQSAGRGSRTTSTQARSAAMARHRRGGG